MPKISPVNYKKLVKIFELSGFELLREKGDHLIYGRKDVYRPIVIPRYKNVPIFIIERNLKTAHISRDEYFELLKKI